jgi:hypothetical protein
MGNRDGMQQTVELARPKVQKFPQFGKLRIEVAPRSGTIFGGG